MPSRSPSIKDVASEAEVSVGTVSRALRGRGRVATATRKRILSVAERIGYKIDPVLSEALSRARHRAQAVQRGAVGLLLPGERETVSSGTSECLEAMKASLENFGYSLDIIRPDSDYLGAPLRLVEVIRARGLQALISMEMIYPLVQGPLITMSLRQAAPELPMVRVGHGDGLGGQDWKIAYDRYAAGFTGTEKAFESGYRRPGLALPIGRRFVNEELRAGYLRALGRFLPDGTKIPAFIYDSADEDAANKLDEWLAAEEIDCLLTHTITRIAGRLATARGIPLIDFELPFDSPPEMPGLRPNWREMGLLAVETIMNRLKYRDGETFEDKGRLLVAAHFCGELPLAPGFAGKQFRPIDLSAHLNSRVTEPGQWFGDFPLPLYGPDCLHGVSPVFQLSEKAPGMVSGVMFRSTVKAGSERPAALTFRLDHREASNTPCKLHFLMGCGHAQRGARAGRIVVEKDSGQRVAERILVAGGRPQAAPNANIQDWWPHNPAVKGVVPVYHPHDPQFFGSLYHLTIPLPTVEGPIVCRIEAEPESKTTLALLAVSQETPQ